MLSNSPRVQRPIKALCLVAGVAMLVMMLHIVADVAARMIFNSPFNGTMEIVAGYYMVAVIFLPLGYVTHHEGHITVEVFTRRLPYRRLVGLEAAVGAVCIVFLCWFTWESVSSAYKSFVTGEQWETAADLVTIWPSRWILPIGLAGMIAFMVCRFVDDVRAAFGKLQEGSPDGARNPSADAGA